MFGERPLSDLARRLLAQERDRTENDALKSRAMDRARAVAERDRPSGIGLIEPKAAVARGPRRLRTLLLIAAALAAAGLAVAGVGAFMEQPSNGQPALSPAKARAPRARQVAVGGALLGGMPSAAPAPEVPTMQPPAPAPSGNAETARASNAKQYARELALLEPARSGIARGEYGSALAAIAQHRRDFPNGQLSEEREALRVRALWGLGQRPAALAAAKVFRKRYPRSGLLGWLNAQGETR